MENAENIFAGSAEALRKYKAENCERFKNKRCFIIGNGPSLKPEDLDKIHEAGDFSIASSRIFLIFDKTKWRPNIYTAWGEYGVNFAKADIEALDAELKIIPATSDEDVPMIDGALYIRRSNPKSDFIWITQETLPHFSSDITSKIYNGKCVTYFNIQIAAWLGFKEIILIGMDHVLPKMLRYPTLKNKTLRPGEQFVMNPVILNVDGMTYKTAYFCENYLEGLYGWKPGDDYPKHNLYPFETVELAYKAAKKYAEEHDIKILNATRGGRLEIFKWVSFDDLFEANLKYEEGIKMLTPNFKRSAKVLSEYKNKYEGRRCFIVGNGPSLKAEDLDKIHANGDFSIASNRIFLIFDQTDWRPNIYTARDSKGIQPSIKEISAINAELKLIVVPQGEKMYPVEGALPLRMLPDDGMWLFTRQTPPFSDDITRGAYLSHTITYINTQVAIYLGFKEIYLIGIDHAYSTLFHVQKDIKNYDFVKNKAGYKEGDQVEIKPEVEHVAGIKNHFTDKYMDGAMGGGGEELGAYYIDEATLSYQSSKKYAQAHGIKIMNATRGGRLNVFRRVDFDSLFPNLK